jgi:phytoene/squalene synthetase
VPTTPSPQQQETASSPSAVDDVTQKLAQTLSVNNDADTKPTDQLITAAAADLDRYPTLQFIYFCQDIW